MSFSLVQRESDSLAAYYCKKPASLEPLDPRERPKDNVANDIANGVFYRCDVEVNSYEDLFNTLDNFFSLGADAQASIEPDPMDIDFEDSTCSTFTIQTQCSLSFVVRMLFELGRGTDRFRKLPGYEFAATVKAVDDIDLIYGTHSYKVTLLRPLPRQTLPFLESNEIQPVWSLRHNDPTAYDFSEIRVDDDHLSPITRAANALNELGSDDLLATLNILPASLFQMGSILYSTATHGADPQAALSGAARSIQGASHLAMQSVGGALSSTREMVSSSAQNAFDSLISRFSVSEAEISAPPTPLTERAQAIIDSAIRESVHLARLKLTEGAEAAVQAVTFAARDTVTAIAEQIVESLRDKTPAEVEEELREMERRVRDKDSELVVMLDLSPEFVRQLEEGLPEVHLSSDDSTESDEKFALVPKPPPIGGKPVVLDEEAGYATPDEQSPSDDERERVQEQMKTENDLFANAEDSIASSELAHSSTPYPGLFPPPLSPPPLSDTEFAPWPMPFLGVPRRGPADSSESSEEEDNA